MLDWPKGGHLTSRFAGRPVGLLRHRRVTHSWIACSGEVGVVSPSLRGGAEWT